MTNKEQLAKLNADLATKPYMSGWFPSQSDVDCMKDLKIDSGVESYPHLNRWKTHIESFPVSERSSWPAKLAEKSSAKEQDDDFDPFADDDDDGEAERAKAERAAKMAEQKKGAAKPGVVAKSSIVLDVKVWDDETDLNEVERLVRTIEKDGLLFGKAQKVPLAFGISKLQIVCVVEDEKVSVDWLTEQIEEIELVQSTDIAAFNKI